MGKIGLRRVLVGVSENSSDVCVRNFGFVLDFF